MGSRLLESACARTPRGATICRMRNRMLTALLCLALLFQVAGCAAVLSALPSVISWVSDAATILDQIDSYANVFFVAHPDVDKQRYVGQAISKARAALNAALRTTQGTQELSKDEVDKAFQDFRSAYSELLVVVGPIGVRQEGKAVYGMSAAGDQLVVPPPLAMHR